MSTDALLIEKVLQQDRMAMRQMMRLYGGAMLAAARSLCPQYADDIVQEAWIAAIGGLPQFEQKSSLKTWLIRITINKAYNHLRKQRPEVSLEGLAEQDDPLNHQFDEQSHWRQGWSAWPEQSPHELLEVHVLKECLEKHIALLPEGQRAVLVQGELLGLEPNDVCNNLAISASNYRVLLHRARVRIHAMVAHYQESGEC